MRLDSGNGEPRSGEHHAALRGESLWPRRDQLAATPAREVAASVLDPTGKAPRGTMVVQDVPISRVFMTYLETEAMNRTFEEKEFVLIADAENPLF